MRTNSRSSRFSTARIGVIIIVIVLLFLQGFFERGLHFLQKPFAFFGTWIYQKSIPKDIQELQNRLADLAIDNAQLELTQRENSQLRETLNFVERQDLSSVMASIVSRSNTANLTIFSLDRGQRDGIKIGDPVIVKNGILVGKIINVTTSSATVQSLTDPNLATAASILNDNRTIGVCEGMNGNLLHLKFIPQDTKISVNDLVVTSGIESNIPSGLLIGLVNEVKMESNAPFLEAIVEPLEDMRQFTAVHVLISSSFDAL